jgi:hypothetical protein
MAKKIVIEDREWEKEENKYKYCEALEDGNILFFPSLPFLLPKEKGMKEFLPAFLSPYQSNFRSLQEKGGKRRERRGILHLDAFAASPLHGARILRFFINMSPADEGKHWVTADGFEDLAKAYGETVSIPPTVNYSLKSRIGRKFMKLLRSSGIKIPIRSPYDTFMLKMNRFLKENKEFQENCKKDYWEFPPGSCWVLFADQVSHTAIDDPYVIEETFVIPQHVLLCPEKSPASILERMSGRNLINPEFFCEKN